ncbi:hypothetical protein SRB5_09070 [Streptomyces sp. RB5]|uniref:Uncharacterized protein n=1 Tax=Streptomyces smaragdinus TaxID=2585196 RepID=A0A7K0CDE8_9ACTN|nr:DUF5959 family protein [Streptomyces smaragdinus]MQY10794.1 hypothetical protein [Streptomyces smaragdinus]
MNPSAQSAPTELIRLADAVQSVSVRLRSTEPSREDGGVRYYAAEVVVTSGFVNGTVYLGFDSEDVLDWGRLLDAVEEVEQEGGLTEPFAADWPRSGETAYLRLFIEDPYVVEVHDGFSTQIVVSIPLMLREDWIAESRQRLAEVRRALG